MPGWSSGIWTSSRGDLLRHELVSDCQAAANERIALYDPPNSPLFAAGDIAVRGDFSHLREMAAYLTKIESIVQFSDALPFGHCIVESGALKLLSIAASPGTGYRNVHDLVAPGQTDWPALGLLRHEIFDRVYNALNELYGYGVGPQQSTFSGGNTDYGEGATPAAALAVSYSGLTYATPAPAGLTFTGLGREGQCLIVDPGEPTEHWYVGWEYLDHADGPIDTSFFAGQTLSKAYVELVDRSVGASDEALQFGVWVGGTKIGTGTTGSPHYTRFDGDEAFLWEITNLALVNTSGDTAVSLRVDPQSQMTTAPSWTPTDHLEMHTQGLKLWEINIIGCVQFDYRKP